MLISKGANHQLKEFRKNKVFSKEITDQFLENIIIPSKELILASKNLGEKLHSNPEFMYDWAQSYRDRRQILIVDGQCRFIEKTGTTVIVTTYDLGMNYSEGTKIVFNDRGRLFSDQSEVFSGKHKVFDKDKAIHIAKGDVPVFVFAMFLDTVELEYEVLQPKARSKKLPRNESKNESDFKVTRFYSTYFKTLILNHGFGVRGHWRQQRCGKGFSEIRTTWVKEHAKQGYTRRADIDRNPLLQS